MSYRSVDSKMEKRAQRARVCEREKGGSGKQEEDGDNVTNENRWSEGE